MPYLLSRLNISKNLFHLLLIDLTKKNHEKSGGKHQLDLGPLLIVHVEGISNCSVLSSLNTSLHKFIIDLRLDNVHLASIPIAYWMLKNLGLNHDPAASTAALPHVEEEAKVRRLNCSRHVAILEEGNIFRH